MPPFHSFVLSAALAATASAQALTADEVLPDLGVDPGNTVQYGRMVALDFDGDHVLDVAFHNHDRVDVMAAPANYMAPVNDVVDANDLDVVEGGAANGGDRIAVVNGTGLQVVEWTNATKSWTTTSLETSDWAGALLVRAGEPASAGAMPAFLGVMSNGVTVRHYWFDGSAWQDDVVTTLGSSALDIGFVDWTGDANADGFAATQTTLDVFAGFPSGSMNTVPRDSYPLSGGVVYDAVAVGRQNAGSADWIGYVLTVPPASQFLGTVDDAGAATPLAVPGANGITGIGAGELSGDLGTDLALSMIADHKVSVLGNHSTGQSLPFLFQDNTNTWDGHTVLDLAPSGTAASNTALPLIADLDNDGDGDVAMAVQSNNTLELFENGYQVAAETLQPELPATPAGSAQNPGGGGVTPPKTVYDFMNELDVQAVTLEVNIGHDPNVVPSGNVFTEVILWERPDPEEPTRPTPVDSVLMPLPIPLPNDPWVEALSPALELPAIENNTTIYFLEQRYVVYNAAGTEVVDVSPSRLFGLQLQDVSCVLAQSCTVDNHDFLMSLSGGSLFYELPREDVNRGSQQGPASLGSIVPIACIPNFPVADPPYNAPIQ